jgi:hypothetical protein
VASLTREAAGDKAVSWDMSVQQYTYYPEPKELPRTLKLVCARSKLAVVKSDDRSRISKTKRPLSDKDVCGAYICVERLCVDPLLEASQPRSRWRITGLECTHVHESCFSYHESWSGPLPTAPQAQALAARAELVDKVLALGMPLARTHRVMNLLDAGMSRADITRAVRAATGVPEEDATPDDVTAMVESINAANERGGYAWLIKSSDQPVWMRQAGQDLPRGEELAAKEIVRGAFWMERSQHVLAEAFPGLIIVDAQARATRLVPPVSCPSLWLPRLLVVLFRSICSLLRSCVSCPSASTVLFTHLIGSTFSLVFSVLLSFAVRGFILEVLRFPSSSGTPTSADLLLSDVTALVASSSSRTLSSVMRLARLSE